MFRSWIDYQAAGSDNIERSQGKWGPYYQLKAGVREEMAPWYKGRFWLYDSRLQGSVDEDPDGLIKIIEKVIQQYGVDVILLDNLMTGLDLEKNMGEDKYERQSLFVKMLIRLALQYNVLILLVAHKRKTYGNDMVNDSVSGSLDIVNLASIVMSYERPTKKRLEGGDVTKDDRVLKVTKNRLFGNTNNYGFVLHYDEKCKRIYISEMEQNKKYGWNRYDQAEIETDDLPF